MSCCGVREGGGWGEGEGGVLTLPCMMRRMVRVTLGLSGDERSGEAILVELAEEGAGRGWRARGCTEGLHGVTSQPGGEDGQPGPGAGGS